MSNLPITIDTLIHGKVIENERIEFKKGWDPKDVMHTLCAFANDINNIGGGYIIIGVEERDGIPLLPPMGVDELQIDKFQKKLLEISKNIIPNYYPVASVEEYLGKSIFVIRAPGGDNRPYKCPEKLKEEFGKLSSSKVSYIRRFSSTVKAGIDEERQLFELAAKIPFDDRINHKAAVEDLSPVLIQDHIRQVGLAIPDDAPFSDFIGACMRLEIIKGPVEYLKPVNAGLLLFNERPDSFFPGTQIDVVIYHDEEGNELTEKIFNGPIQYQLKNVLSYIQNNIIEERVKKIQGQAEAERFFNYPFAALEEAIANAVYHRSYEIPQPIEISIRPDKIDILSYPGPLPPVDNAQLQSERIVARYYRNRKIGDFLKELRLTEGRGTGIFKIKRVMGRNGSPAPYFETDPNRTYFLTQLPIHTAFKRITSFIKKEERSLEDIQYFILRFCEISKSRKEIFEFLEMDNTSRNMQKYISPLIAEGYIEFTLPNTPKSSKQKYKTTLKGIVFLEEGNDF